MFGELSAFDREPRANSVITISESFVVRVSGSDFRQIISR